ncbi:MAG: glycosyltransferase family 1 protein [Acidimicrobiales bacterium]
MTKRIAVMVEQFWHRVPGGTARATAETLRALVALDDLDIVGVAAAHRQSAASAFASPVPIKHARLPRPVLYDSWHRLGFPSIEQVTGPVDLVWASAMVLPPATVPIVTTVHDLAFLDAPERLSRRGRTFFPLAWEVTKARSTLITCPSEVVAADCESYGIDAKRLRVIPWGVTVDPVDQASIDEVRSRFGLPERFVLWVGTLEPRKSAVGLIAPWSRYPMSPLVVAGPEGWVPRWRRCPEVPRRPGHSGQVDDADLRALYAAASVFVLPSFAEGFGLPVLEAMSQGTPVVTSTGTATAEVACDAAILVDPTDSSALAAAIGRILTDHELASELGEQGRQQALRCSWKSTGQHYAKIFDEAIELGISAR